MDLAIAAAKALMRAWRPAPAPDDHWRNYQTSIESERRAIRLASARYRYNYERETCYFDHYFPRFDTAAFVGKRLLDLGCFTGGRLVYWIQRYGLVGTGVDIEERLALGGREFAEETGILATFDVAFAEALPYADGSFDYVVSYDVLEHVRSVQQALKECHRILKQGGSYLPSSRSSTSRWSRTLGKRRRCRLCIGYSRGQC